jgi:hypothetical protein
MSVNALSNPHQFPSATVSTAAELDRRRVLRVLRERARYRYVRPMLQPAADGWRVTSPCCSRTVDPDGGVIDIAWLERVGSRWRIYYKDHAARCWTPCRDGRLTDLLELLRLDPDRIFWP